MKYYIYISDTKVDMLYPQIPKSLLKKIASSLSIDLKLLGAEINIGAKSGQSDETRYSKVRIVSEYIEKHLDVGTVDAPSTYFKGNLLMQYGNLEVHSFMEPATKYPSAIYFGGTTQHTILGMSGSLSHVLGGNVESIETARRIFPPSNLAGFLSVLKELYAESENDKYQEKHMYNYVLDEVAMLSGLMDGAEQQLEFLAKTLLQGNFSFDNKHVVLGTPIYVAIAD